MKILLTHYDLDGVASAIILNRLFKFDHIWKGAYHRLDKFIADVPRGAKVVVSDLSLTEEQFTNLKWKTEQLIIIDHHPGTELLKNDHPEARITFDGEKSATLLCYEMVYPHLTNDKFIKNFEKLAIHANAYDLYKEDTPEFATGYDLNLLFWIHHFDEFFNLFENGLSQFDADRSREISDKKKSIHNALEASTYCEFPVEHDITSLLAVMSSPSLANDVPRFKPGYDLYYMVTKFKEAWRVSIRSKGPVVNTACEWLKENYSCVIDGGGHPAASGLGIDPTTPQEYMVALLVTLNEKIIAIHKE